MPYRALTQLIDSHFEALSPELQRAARWVREHPAELGLQSLRASARAAGVAPATLSRLSHALGLADFEAMRRPVVEALARGVGSGHGTPDETARPLTQAQLRNVASTAARNPVEVVNAAADLLLSARQLTFLGLRASFGIAHHLRYACDWLRPGTLLAGDASGALLDQIAQLTEADGLVVVSQAPYTRQTVECAHVAHAAGVPIVALTDNPLSPWRGWRGTRCCLTRGPRPSSIPWQAHRRSPKPWWPRWPRVAANRWCVAWPRCRRVSTPTKPIGKNAL